MILIVKRKKIPHCVTQIAQKLLINPVDCQSLVTLNLKNNFWLNLISHQPNFDKIYLYVKDPFESNFQLSIKQREHICSKQIDSV